MTTTIDPGFSDTAGDVASLTKGASPEVTNGVINGAVITADEYLAGRGFIDPDKTKEWGCYVAPDHKGHNRLWVPWRDKDGQIIYESGRIVDDVLFKDYGEPKWYHRGVNGHPTSPKPPLFATPGAYEARSIVLVESHMDALAWAYAGHPAFATAGASVSSFSKEALHLLNPKEEITLNPQNDESKIDRNGAQMQPAAERWEQGMTALLENMLPRLYVTRIDRNVAEDSCDLLQRLGSETLQSSVYVNRERVASAHRRVMRGDEWLAHHGEGKSALWGDEDEILWAPGQSVIIAADTGYGKTTLGQQVVLASMGIGEPEVLGLPVAHMERPVFYIAADRPVQILEAMRRRLTDADIPILNQKLIVNDGVPQTLISDDSEAFVEWLLNYSPGLVVIDSLKDVAMDLVSDEVGAGITHTVNLLVREGVEVMILHHTNKQFMGSKPTISSIYGSSLICHGAGAVLTLSGDRDSAFRDLDVLKRPKGYVERMNLIIDESAGMFHIAPAQADELFAYLSQHGQATVQQLAQAAWGQFNDTTKKRVQRRLKADPRVQKIPGQHTPQGRAPDVWVLSQQQTA